MKFQYLAFAGVFACALILAQKPPAPTPAAPGAPVQPHQQQSPQQQQHSQQQQPQVMVWTSNAGGSFLGVHATDVDAGRARELKLKEERGVEITSVEPGSPAEKAGILMNDVVLEYNGQRVEGTEQFVRVVRETPAGRQVKIGLWRSGGPQYVTATIGRRKAKTPKELIESLSSVRELPQLPQVWIPDIPRAFTTWKSSMLGLEAEGIEAQLAQFFGVEEGVLVRSVAEGSAAEKAGLKAGDVIVKVDGKPVDTPRAVSAEMRAIRPRRTFPLGVVREKREISLSVTLEEESENERKERRVTQREDDR
ncbi:MAG: PDZ domain-containing protein [Acidobacteriota bacterium]